MNLPYGVTGFYNSTIDKPHEIDDRPFKDICFNLTRKYQGRILDMDESKLATNFFKVKININHQDLYVLLNMYYPFLTFASDLEFQRLQFIDHPVLSKDFMPFYKVLSKDELSSPLKIRKRKGQITLENINKLNTTELEQILYWQPKNVGEVIFNFWD
ncbi:hypothetical protein [Priestia endophytica]|uniref:hypothetical protein n=1 Tax=Priestia endophytica TaxID=135735 RepID=UPI002E1DB5B9|nr:hypothetical protein [Priestia endophytica]